MSTGQGPSTGSPHFVQSVDRAARLMIALGGSPRGLSLADVSRAADLNKSTARRLLVTLMTSGFVRQVPPTDHYTLGPRLLELTRSVGAHLFAGSHVRSILVRLRDELNETVHLAIPDGYELVYLEKVASSQSLGISSTVGARISLYCTGLGQAYLAHMPDSWVQEYLSVTPLERRTPRTVVSEPLLRAKLAQTRATGYSLDDVENEDGIRCVGAPVLDASGEPVAAVSATAPVSRLTGEMVPAFGSRVRAAAELVAATLR